MLYSIQYLRAIAASLVVLFHASLHLTGAYGVPTFAKGGIGVDIFFIISGFIMWQLTAKSQQPTPAEFFGQRLTRIGPLYWLVTLLMFAMPAISGTIAGSTQYDFWHLTSSLLFVATPYPANPAGWYPVYVPGWTLNYEMFFYALFALSLFVRSAWARLASMIGGLVALVVAGKALSFSGPLSFYTSGILLEFAAGMLIGAFHASGYRVPRTAALGAVAASFIGFYLAPEITPVREFVWGPPAALLVLGAISLERLEYVSKSSGLKLLGNASYALYLTHLFAIGVVVILWRKFGLWSLGFAGGAAFLIAAFGGSLAVSVIVHLYVEKPLTALARRTSRPVLREAGTGSDQPSPL